MDRLKRAMEPLEEQSEEQDKVQLEETGTVSIETSVCEKDEDIEELSNKDKEESVKDEETNNKEIESQSTELTEEYEGVQTRSKTSKKED